MATIDVELSAQGMDKLISELKDYKKSLKSKNRRFIKLLLEKGITVAEEKKADGSHKLPPKISFRKEIKAEDGAVVALLIGAGEPFSSKWRSKDDNWYDDLVYPLSMLEFGSAGYALESPEETFGAGSVGRGTFSRMGHENDFVWHVERDDGRRAATAIRPTRPMYHAALKMQEEVINAAKEAFGGS